MQPRFHLLSSLFVFFFIHCAQADRISLDTSSSAGLLFNAGFDFFRNATGKQITTFRFRAIENHLLQDFEGTIVGNQILIQGVPFGAVTRLKASFDSSAGATVFVNGTAQKSGDTSNDFSSPVRYEVVAGNGQKDAYSVSVNVITPITDAGQTDCFDATASVIACGLGSLPGQDGDVSGLTSNLERTTLTSDSSQPVVVDKNTGLVWKTCKEGTNPIDCSALAAPTLFSYADAAVACSNLNVSGYAGLKNWRIPDLQELFTIASFSNAGPYTNMTVFPDGNQTFWSRSMADPASFTPRRWVYNFSNGNNEDAAEVGTLPVRCVAGGSYPAQNFTDLGDGTILDNNTNLLWQKCSVGQSGTSCQNSATTFFDWRDALVQCDSLPSTGGKWRVPNVREYLTIAKYDVLMGTNAIDLNVFPANLASGSYWTSNVSQLAGNLGVFTFDVQYGRLSRSGATYTDFVRCVKNAP
ncbi:DUF1566 domain-containing protein [Leptospira stimsonii]|uniref:DUF1566 domain-containing protein n=1 Tax=Leptospira stimsonii TaxID=2202203 RepID=A0ABY2N9K1_9LEPT|nr:DUF1566 domain-containing protein [Leptospira stimsonii]TGK18564.1 DUF1566 domain-containing protein [Leptospira stimsonii]TGM19035.1 DUF1566 domain-containing protein [Leptospira stimsonii]